MAYTPKTWVCGETITADGLNNIEEGVQEALECCDHGYECITTETEVYDGSASSTQSYNGAYRSDVIIQQSDLQVDSAKVVFNDVEYQVDKGVFYGFTYYGAPFTGGFSPQSFSQYPFSLYSDGNGYRVATPQSSTNDIKVTAIETTIETDECFEKAMKKFVPQNIADYGMSSIIEGAITSNTASGNHSHAEGDNTVASGDNSHAEGYGAVASNNYSHAEGYGAVASGSCSHAEGNNTTASGNGSHTEGESTTASGNGSHTEGESTTASGSYSHAEGVGTVSKNASQHVFGEFNVEDPSLADEYNRGTYVEIVGNGLWSDSRSNARTLDWDGNEWLAGTLTLGNTTITEAQLQALLALL